MLGNRSGGNGQYGYYYEQYWADQAAWGNYAKLRGKRGVEEKEEKKASAREESRLWEEWLESDSEEEDDERPVPWDVTVNVELTNRQFMERSVENYKEDYPQCKRDDNSGRFIACYMCFRGVTVKNLTNGRTNAHRQVGEKNDEQMHKGI